MRHKRFLPLCSIAVVLLFVWCVPHGREIGYGVPRETGVRRAALEAVGRAGIGKALRTVAFIEQPRTGKGAPLFVSRIAAGSVSFFQDHIVFHLSRNMGQIKKMVASNTVLAGFSSRMRARRSASPHVAPLSFSVRYPGSNPAVTVEGVGMRAETASMFKGADPSQWAQRCSTFDTLVYRDLYDGIDLRFFGAAGEVKYEFVVRPGASYDRIRMTYTGADSVIITHDGGLGIAVGNQLISEPAPFVYQAYGSERKERSSRFFNATAHDIGFVVSGVDSARPLVIDPVYSTLIGGSNVDGLNAFQVINDSILVLALTTSSTDIALIDGLYKEYNGGYFDSMIMVFNIHSGAIVHSSYFGGSDEENSIAVILHQNRIILVGNTYSRDMPTTSGAMQSNLRGEENCFIAEFNMGCDTLLASTYLGGSGIDVVASACADTSGAIWLAGWSTSAGSFPRTANAAQATYKGGDDDAFVAAISPDCGKLLYGSFLGGNFYDEARDINVDTSGRVVVCGYTTSDNYPVTSNAIQKGRKGWEAGFITALRAQNGAIEYSSYFGGSYQDFFEKLDITNDGFILFGETCSMDAPVTMGVFQSKRGNPDSAIFSWDNFILRLDTAFRVKWCSYLGGGSEEDASSIVFRDGTVYAAGYTISRDFPLQNQLLNYQKKEDMTLTVVDGDGKHILFSTYWGGESYDYSSAIAVRNNFVYLAGASASTNYPLTQNAWKKDRTGDNDATLTIFSLDELRLTATESPGTVPTTLSIVHNYPNPFQGSTEVVFALGAPGNVLLCVYDAQGRLVESRNLSRLEAGRHGYTLRTTDWAPGVYYCSISAGGSTATRKLVKLAR